MKKLFVLVGCVLILIGCEKKYPDQYLLDLCLRTSTYPDYSKCKCAVLKYEATLSHFEREELLNATGHLFPGYGWSVRTPERMKMTNKILDKYKKACVACGIQ